MGRKPQVQARIPEDVKDGIDEYCDEHDVTQSDAVRRALQRTYLDAEQLRDEFDDTNSINQTYRLLLGRLIAVALAAGIGAFAGAGGAM